MVRALNVNPEVCGHISAEAPQHQPRDVDTSVLRPLNVNPEVSDLRRDLKVVYAYSSFFPSSFLGISPRKPLAGLILSWHQLLEGSEQLESLGAANALYSEDGDDKYLNKTMSRLRGQSDNRYLNIY
ncbi:hypothetical protein H8959_018336 [Pygathrix nigripes]